VREALPDVPAELPHSSVFFACDDIRRTDSEMTSRRITFPQPPVKMAFGWWAMLEDDEGTRYALGESE
jgi:predicted enzyme related to lactoylglutathione lyase